MNFEKKSEKKEELKTYLSCNGLSFELPDRILFENINISINKGDRIALVGDNGAGKSTLLKILAGELQPTSGVINNNDRSRYYLPQVDFSVTKDKRTLGEYLATKIDETWIVDQKLKSVFGTKDINYDQPVATLSGGEITKINLAIGLVLDPDMFFLDEPTNHMDILAMENLRQALEEYRGALVVVSHNSFFLDQVAKKVWQLDQGRIEAYGGNCSDYMEQKRIELEAQERKHEVSKKKLRKLKYSAQIEQKRAAKSRSIGKQSAGDRSMSGMEKGTFANIASASAGKGSAKFRELIGKAQEEVDNTRVMRKKTVSASLITETEIGHKNLITLKHGRLEIGGQTLLDGLDLNLRYGDRIAICGANGSGKTVLAHALVGGGEEGESNGLSGEYRKAENLRVAYISQKYEIIDPDKSLLENVLVFNPRATFEEARFALGRFLFRVDAIVNRPARLLSGGEMARLAFAMVTTAPIDLLVLDEPTNNLDMATIQEIIEALREFDGGLLAISHDINFMKNIGIDEAYFLGDSTMIKMSTTPAQPESFYQELITKIRHDK